MKKNWEIKKLGDVCEFRRGLTYSKNDEVENSRNAVLRSNNIDLVTNRLDLSEIKYISDKIKIDETKKVKRDSLLICTANGSKAHLGKVALIDDDYDFAFGGFMGLLIPSESVYPRFFYYALISENYKKFIKSLSDGANINNLKFQDLSKFEILVPPLEEQKRIVKILDEKFTQLETIKANAQTNLQNAKDLFQSQLTKAFVFPQENTNTTWEKKRLGDVSTVTSSKRIYAEEQTESGIPFLRVSDLVSRINGIETNDLYISEEKYFEFVSKELVPKENDLLITSRGTLGLCYIVKEDDKFYFQDGMITWISLQPCLQSKFVSYLFDSPIIKNQISEKAAGAAVSYISISDIRLFEIPLLPLPEQKRIVNELDTLSEKVRQLQEIYTKQIANCAELKQAYLQKAFEGEL